MAIIQVQDLSFAYQGNPEPVFTGLNFHMDSSWRLGLVGRNGRGKTTLLRLLAGQLQGQGQVVSSQKLHYFPFEADLFRPAREALIDSLHPYTAWEKQMEAALLDGSPVALASYGELLSQYLARDGYSIRELMNREAALMGIDPASLERPLSQFSPGERSRLMLAALFLQPGHFLLIDEPTNHLDAPTRDSIRDYLLSKTGFLVVSHNRDFLNQVCDHILALEKSNARVVAGNYASYIKDKKEQDAREMAQRQRLQGDIRRLQQAARQKAQWSDRLEATKTGQGPVDRGYIGAKSASMMKKAKALESRIDRQIAEKEALLVNLEYSAPIRLEGLSHDSRTLLRLSDVHFSYGDRQILSGFSLALAQGERLAIRGGNGSGKTTLLKLLSGEQSPTSGSLWRASKLIISSLPQTSQGISGNPRELALSKGLDLTRFLTFLRKFDLPREAFLQDITRLSLGQRKKVLLSLSLAEHAHLYLWDEPLNDIDPESREQIEDMLVDTKASLVFIEHEDSFVNKVASRVVDLG